MSTKNESPFAQGILHAWKAGSVSVPGLLLLHYHRLNLSELDVLLIIHLMYFKEIEHKEFPTWEELASRMSVPATQVSHIIQRLIKEGILHIEEDIDPHSRVQFERYSLAPLAAKLAAVAETIVAAASAPNASPAEIAGTSNLAAVSVAEPSGGGAVEEAAQAAQVTDRRAQMSFSIFAVFEQEFARPLSPMEYETISSWIDEDRYSEELILMALKEAVFAGKLHLRYIDRILIEWSRNRVRTAEQAKEYAQRFRGTR